MYQSLYNWLSDNYPALNIDLIVTDDRINVWVPDHHKRLIIIYNTTHTNTITCYLDTNGQHKYILTHNLGDPKLFELLTTTINTNLL